MTAITLALLVSLAPQPSQAAPWGWAAASPAGGWIEKLAEGWGRLWGGERPLPRRPSGIAQPKIGCGIDPNGQPICSPGTGGGSGMTTSTTPPNPEG